MNVAEAEGARVRSSRGVGGQVLSVTAGGGGVVCWTAEVGRSQFTFQGLTLSSSTVTSDTSFPTGNGLHVPAASLSYFCLPFRTVAYTRHTPDTLHISIIFVLGIQPCEPPFRDTPASQLIPARSNDDEGGLSRSRA